MAGRNIPSHRRKHAANDGSPSVTDTQERDFVAMLNDIAAAWRHSRRQQFAIPTYRDSLNHREWQPERISERIALMRKWLGLSQSEMADMLGMTMRAYRDWERPGARRWRRAEPLLKLALATDVSLDWLLGGIGSPSRSP